MSAQSIAQATTAAQRSGASLLLRMGNATAVFADLDDPVAGVYANRATETQFGNVSGQARDITFRCALPAVADIDEGCALVITYAGQELPYVVQHTEDDVEMLITVLILADNPAGLD